jgi:hypothetical protein
MTDVKKIILDKFNGCDVAQIPYVNVALGHFEATLRKDGAGIEVATLGNQPFLPWTVFQEAVCAMSVNGGTAKKGDAMRHCLGEDKLPLDSIEGRIAHRVYGRQPGDTVFRRITPIAGILIWAGVCKNMPGLLRLNPNIQMQTNCEE